MDDGLVVIGKEKTPAELANMERSTYVVAGTGGKRIRFPNGREAGPIDGEALRLALARGALVIGEEPLKTFKGKSVPDQRNEAQRQEVAQQRDARLSVHPLY